MRPTGFSTGAVAKGDFRRGIELQSRVPGVAAIELSALRDHELNELVAAIPDLPLESYAYVSVHAPSRLKTLSEEEVIETLDQVPMDWPIVVHPDIIETPSNWCRFGRRLCLENMDNRKATGRTLAELRELLALFPDATFCLDLGHARQIDPTMALAFALLTEFAERLVQLHVSEVGPTGEHSAVRALAATAFRRLAHRVPSDCAVIIESVVGPEDIETEFQTVSGLFSGSPQRTIA